MLRELFHELTVNFVPEGSREYPTPYLRRTRGVTAVAAFHTGWGRRAFNSGRGGGSIEPPG